MIPGLGKLFKCRKHLFRLLSSIEINEMLANSLVKQYLKNITDALPKDANYHLSQLVDKRRLIEEELRELESIQETDIEMRKMIEDDRKKYHGQIHLMNCDILVSLLPEDDSNRDVMIEVTAGIGGKEAMLFAAELFEMYARHASFKNWYFEVQEEDIPEGGGMRHGSAYISGRGVGHLIEEAGVHRVQRIPATEKSGRVHTSTVAVAVLPQPTAVEIVIKDSDIKIETKTSSGAGGQHVNKTKSCVRLTHIPTGIVIENQTDRSQIRNHKLALNRLRSKLYQLQLESQLNNAQEERKEQVGASLRSEKIRTYNYNQDRITDHRIGENVHNLPAFMMGGAPLDQLISQLVARSRRKQLMDVIERRLTEKNAF